MNTDLTETVAGVNWRGAGQSGRARSGRRISAVRASRLTEQVRAGPRLRVNPPGCRALQPSAAGCCSDFLSQPRQRGEVICLKSQPRQLGSQLCALNRYAHLLWG